MKVKFVWPADEELGEVIEYYNQKKSGLGQRFFEEVNEAIERIIRFPLASSKVGQNTRRSLLRKFPYSLLYVGRAEYDIGGCSRPSTKKAIILCR